MEELLYAAVVFRTIRIVVRCVGFGWTMVNISELELFFEQINLR